MSTEEMPEKRRSQRRRFWAIVIVGTALVVFDQVLAQLAHQRAWERVQNWQDEPRIAEHIYAVENDEDARMQCIKYQKYIYVWRLCISDQYGIDKFSLAVFYLKPHAYTNIWAHFIKSTVGYYFGVDASAQGALSVYGSNSTYRTENARLF